MMRLGALEIGYGVPTGDFDGRVEAAYSRACLLLLGDHGALTLVASTTGRLPRSILVDAPPKFTVLAANGDRARQASDSVRDAARRQARTALDRSKPAPPA